MAEASLPIATPVAEGGKGCVGMEDGSSERSTRPDPHSLPFVPDIHKQFRFPTCSSFFNVFHPYDPVAYRIEPLLDADLFKKEPALVRKH